MNLCWNEAYRSKLPESIKIVADMFTMECKESDWKSYVEWTIAGWKNIWNTFIAVFAVVFLRVQMEFFMPFFGDNWGNSISPGWLILNILLLSWGNFFNKRSHAQIIAFLAECTHQCQLFLPTSVGEKRLSWLFSELKLRWSFTVFPMTIFEKHKHKY